MKRFTVCVGICHVFARVASGAEYAFSSCRCFVPVSGSVCCRACWRFPGCGVCAFFLARERFTGGVVLGASASFPCTCGMRGVLERFGRACGSSSRCVSCPLTEYGRDEGGGRRVGCARVLLRTCVVRSYSSCWCDHCPWTSIRMLRCELLLSSLFVRCHAGPNIVACLDTYIGVEIDSTDEDLSCSDYVHTHAAGERLPNNAPPPHTARSGERTSAHFRIGHRLAPRGHKRSRRRELAAAVSTVSIKDTVIESG